MTFTSTCTYILLAALVDYPDTLQAYLGLMSSVCTCVYYIHIHIIMYTYMYMYMYKLDAVSPRGVLFLFYPEGIESVSSPPPEYHWNITKSLRHWYNTCIDIGTMYMYIQVHWYMCICILYSIYIM